MNKITQSEIESISSEFGVEAKSVKAILQVECSGSGFDQTTGKIKIQFEPYWFQKYTGIRIANRVENQKAEWMVYESALKINPDAADKSTSWGLGQVMGFNYKEAGYSSVHAMVEDFKLGEANQLRGMLKFIKATPGMFMALKSKDWATFARYYNGPKYKDFNYDTRLQKAYSGS